MIKQDKHSREYLFTLHNTKIAQTHTRGLKLAAARSPPTPVFPSDFQILIWSLMR